MATFEEIAKKNQGTKIWAKQRLNGEIEAQGTLLLALQKIRHLPPVIIVKFADGIEHFSPDQILLSPPSPRQTILF